MNKQQTEALNLAFQEMDDFIQEANDLIDPEFPEVLDLCDLTEQVEKATY